MKRMLVRVLHAATVAGFLAMWHVPAMAVPTPVHAFDFNGDYVDSITGTATITAEGGSIVGSRHVMDPQVPPGNNHGLTLANANLSSPGVYSIEMYLAYDSVRSIVDQHWIKVVDFKDATIPWGVYYEDMAFTTRWEADPADPGIASTLKMSYPGGGPPVEHTNGQPVMHAGEWNHLVFTRDASSQFSAYVDGELAFTFADTLDYGVFSGPDGIMRFLQNDVVDDSFDYFNVAAGSVEFLNIYDEALAAADVQALAAAAVPEPSTVVLLVGLGVAMAAWRRR